MSKKLKPAVSYLRMSSDKQDKSPEQQRDEMVKLAAKQGFNIVREYIDEAISGDKTEKRVAFQRMIADACELGDFECILCWDQDRFGRFDSLEAGYWIKPLRDRGVRLVTVAQGEIDWNDFAGRMMYAIQQEGKHQFLVGLSRNVLRGVVASVSKGFGAGHAPFGYDKVFFDGQGNLVHRVPGGQSFQKSPGWESSFAPSTTDGEVEAVHDVFEAYANTDVPITSLALQLNDRGQVTRAGKPFCHQTVKRMLSNPVYIGTRVYGREQCGKYHRVVGGGEVMPVKEGRVDSGDGMMIVPDCHEPLVDQTTFDRVQAKMAEAHKPRHGRYGGFLLSGVLFCGHNGTPLFGNVMDASRDNGYYVARIDKESPLVDKTLIESYVLDVLCDWLERVDEKQIWRAVFEMAKRNAATPASSKAIEKRLGSLNRKIEQAVERMLLIDDQNLAEATRLVEKWRGERDDLERKLGAAETVCELNPKAAADKAVAALADLRENIAAADPAAVRGVIKRLIQRITLWWEPHVQGRRNRRISRGMIEYRSGQFKAAGLDSTLFGPDELRQYREPLNRELAAKAVDDLYCGHPVRAAEIADALDRKPGATRMLLCAAESQGLVVRVKQRGWVPPDSDVAAQIKSDRIPLGPEHAALAVAAMANGTLPTTVEVARRLHIPKSTAHLWLPKAAANGWIERVKQGKYCRWRPIDIPESVASKRLPPVSTNLKKGLGHDQTTYTHHRRRVIYGTVFRSSNNSANSSVCGSSAVAGPGP